MTLLSSIGEVICLGLVTCTVALGSHLTLPGSQKLHHSEESDPDPFIRQLEKINRYTTPHFRTNGKDRTSIPTQDSSVSSSSPSYVPISEVREPASSLPPSSTMRKRILPGDGISKDNAQGHVNLGWKFLLDGRPQAAMAAYREALRRQPNSANAYIGMGITLKSMGNVERAVQAIQQALDLNPQLSSALVHMGYFYADGPIGYSDHETARRLFDQAFRLGDPFAGIALQDLGSRSHRKF
jgi:tetratricopeptide (TPR) repeat protein